MTIFAAKKSSPRYFSLAPLTLLRNKVQLYNLNEVCH